MARLSSMKTPKKLSVVDEEDEEEPSDAEDEELESDDGARDRDDAHDESLLSLADKAPFVPAEHGAQEASADFSTPPTRRAALAQHTAVAANTMGADQSKEAVSDALRATASELQAKTGHRVSNGKLTRPSAYKPNPPQRKPATAATTTTVQRRMKGSHQARPDTWELQESPAKPTLRQTATTTTTSTQSFSPLKKQRAKRVEVKEHLQSALEDYHAKDQRQIEEQLNGGSPQFVPEHTEARSSLRRSPRKARTHDPPQEVPAAADDAPSSTRSLRSREVLLDDAVHERQDADAIDDELGSDPELGEESYAALRAQLNINDDAEDDGVEHGGGVHTVQRKVQAVEVPTRPTEPEVTAQKIVSSSPKQTKQSTGRAVWIGKELAREREEKQRAGAQREEKQRRESKRKSAKRGSRSVATRDAATVDGTASAEDEIVMQQDDTADAEYGAHEDAAEGAQDEDEEEEVDPDLIAQPGRARTERAHVRGSELFGPGEILEDSPEKQPAQRKRKAKSNAAANTSKKRQRTGSAAPDEQNNVDDGAEEEQEPESEDEAEIVTHLDRKRLYGQWPNLCCAYRAHRDIGVSKRDGQRQPPCNIFLRDADVKAIIEATEVAMVRLTNHEEAAADLADISRQVYALHRDVDPDGDRVPRMVKNVYFHLFPCLVKLLKRAVERYEQPDGTLRRGGLKTVRELVCMILDLGEGMEQNEFPKPDSRLVLLQPVKNKIIAPLKVVRKVFGRELTSLERAEQGRAARIRDEEVSRRHAQEEEEERRRKERLKKVERKWQQLHMTRRKAEGNCFDKAKLEHLVQPNLHGCPTWEYDQDGEPFERVEVFAPRLGPPRDKVEKAELLIWGSAAVNMLAHGLQEFAGENVYEDLFWAHCGRKGVLNAYNVTEIVTKAAQLREYLIEREGRQDGWILRIPVWTKGHSMGKENSEREQTVEQEVVAGPSRVAGGDQEVGGDGDDGLDGVDE